MERFNNVETTAQETNEADIDFDTNFSLKFKPNSCSNLKRYNSRDLKREIPQSTYLNLPKSDEICVNCNKFINKFTEKSKGCFYHSKKWNGFEYECCMDKNKFSAGCVETRHMTESESKKKAAQVCSNCKEPGHECKMCPWDPNARTGEDPVQELRRISTLQKHRNTRKMNSVKRFKAKEDSFADITLLKNSVVREKMYLTRESNETKDSSILFTKKFKKFY